MNAETEKDFDEYEENDWSAWREEIRREVYSATRECEKIKLGDVSTYSKNASGIVDKLCSLKMEDFYLYADIDYKSDDSDDDYRVQDLLFNIFVCILLGDRANDVINLDPLANPFTSLTPLLSTDQKRLVLRRIFYFNDISFSAETEFNQYFPNLYIYLNMLPIIDRDLIPDICDKVIEFMDDTWRYFPLQSVQPYLSADQVSQILSNLQMMDRRAENDNIEYLNTFRHFLN